ncbi:RnfC1 [Desulfamplus magnetovallimortis]|uniref:Ion-translocating oxidoreductase complex subunit C n=1 Tax=Desulfamplus magnetovallimortis TaxID=1246637 RepID=A0A1W1HCB6_9BACT|nr:electron transport complex subunit RsxC [Desulfamplus magnetovallimortis]SLM30083.1 RnfC1 [Desulfamplus magnetovallimortis]
MGNSKFKGFPGRGSFRHGVHPPDNKSYSAGAAIEVMPSPEQVVLPLLQHIGAPCQPAVKAKQQVVVGDVVASAKAFVSAPVHASIAGKATKPGVVTLPTGRHLPAITIKADKDLPVTSTQEIWDSLKSYEWDFAEIKGFDPHDIASAVHGAGIVGLGGAAFPTHVKLMPDEKKVIHTMMVNGCECEPYLTPDYRIMLEIPEAIVAGAMLAARAVSAKQVIIGIEDNKPDAVEKMEAAIAKTKRTVSDADIRVAMVKTRYPQGSEKQLIKAVLDLEVPLGGLPSDVGVAMSNVGSMVAVANAVIRKVPLTHRVMSVTGGGIKNPKNIFVPIGISVSEVIEFCGGLKPEAARMISGGPMMGFAFSDMNTPITKGTSGITVLTRDELAGGLETSCVRCGRCVEACPMNLVPTRLAMASRYGNVPLAIQYNINACFECGCCTYACPANIKIVQLVRTGKAMVAASKQNEK